MRKFTLFLLFTATIGFGSCQEKKNHENTIFTGAEQTSKYLPLLKDKRVGLVVNQSSMIGKIPLIDSLLSLGVNV
ncbi:MAG TPA: hypothetical protein VJ346_06665, partial [Bacteroidales bacterium]|nr:hypothetical protein [Bacteroidales bacterium]